MSLSFRLQLSDCQTTVCSTKPAFFRNNPLIYRRVNKLLKAGQMQLQIVLAFKV